MEIRNRPGELQAVVALVRRADQCAAAGNRVDAERLVDQAIDACRKIVASHPNDVDAVALAAGCFLKLGRLADAAEWYRRAIELRPGVAQFHQNLGLASLNTGQYDQAEAAFRVSVALSPDSAELQSFLAEVLQQQGRFEEADPLIRYALKQDPSRVPAYLALTNGRRMTEADRPILGQMQEVLRGRISAADASILNYALGKSFSDLGDYEESLKTYDEANRLAAVIMLKGRSFDFAKLQKITEDAKAVFANQPKRGSDSDMPILIVGMMRSGTTLLEQIVSCHPEISAGGELPFWTRYGPEIPSATEGRLREIQDLYLAELGRLSGGKKHVTDKRPSNRYLLGQIHLAFPRAKIIHCKRDPVDTALSIYMTPSSAPVEYGYVRKNIVLAYQEYERLMEFYRAALPPDAMLEVQYEDLVANPESAIRRIIDFLGLEWSDACLRHQENKSAVRTPSLWQVRQPIYSTSVKRWKRYEPWLGAFRELIRES